MALYASSGADERSRAAIRNRWPDVVELGAVEVDRPQEGSGAPASGAAAGAAVRQDRDHTACRVVGSNMYFLIVVA